MTTDVGFTPQLVARARNADLVVFGFNGFAMASWMSRIPDIKQSLDLTPGALSLLLLAISAGSLLGLPLAGRVAHRIGAAKTVRLGLFLAMPGQTVAAVAVQFGHSPWLVVPGLVFVGFGYGIWDVSQNFEGTRIETALGKAIMPWFHAAFSGGTVVGALIGAGLTQLKVPVLAHIAVVVVIGLVAVLWGTGQFLPTLDEGVDQETHDARMKGQKSAWLEPRTLLVGTIVLAAAFAEGTANDWMAVAFVEGHHLSNALGVVAFAVFLLFMTAGRILGTGLLDRYGRVVVLRILFAMAIVGCLLVVFGPTWLAFVGAAIWGVGASLGFPVGMSAAADDPARAPLRLSVVTTIGYTAFLAGPPLLGFLGDHFGVLRALIVVGALSLIAMLVVPITKPLVPTPED
jgi:MFS family permease